MDADILLAVLLTAWVGIGWISFSLTQSYIEGWDYVNKQQYPTLIKISSMLMGLITAIFCIRTIWIYRRNK